MTLLGLAASDLYESLPFAAESEKSDLAKTLDYLEDHLLEMRTSFANAGLFNTRKQQEGETFLQSIWPLSDSRHVNATLATLLRKKSSGIA